MKGRIIDFINGEALPASVQMSDVGVQRIIQVFDEQMKGGLHYGAQLVVLRHGQIVLDRASGYSNIRRKSYVTHDTPFLTFSCAKPFIGICMHRLIEEGKVNMDAPVAEYWPEFGRNGKEVITIRQIFLHRSGIPEGFVEFLLQVPLWHDWQLAIENIANLRSKKLPDTRIAYQFINYGFILGEVIRRVTGQSVEKFFESFITSPLRLKNTYLSLPPKSPNPAAHVYAALNGDWELAMLFKLPSIQQAVIPAASLYSTAREMAVFYQMLLYGGVYGQHTFLKPETIRYATSLGSQGYDFNLGKEMRWAYGFLLGGVIPAGNQPGPSLGNRSTSATFGHVGNGSCMAWADPDADIVVTFTCNRLLDNEATISRWENLSNAVWDAIVS